MGSLNNLRYEVGLFELENGRWNYSVYVSIRSGKRWGSNMQVGKGSAESEAKAIEQAQEKATADRNTREDIATRKVVKLK
jgi:hypothetical protein